MLVAPATALPFPALSLMLHPCRFELGAWGKAALLFCIVISRTLQTAFLLEMRMPCCWRWGWGLVFGAVVLGAVRKEREVSLQISWVEVGKWMYLVEFYPWLMCYHLYMLWWCVCMREIQAFRLLGDNLGPKQKTSSSLPVKHLDLIYPWISLIKSACLADWFSQMSFSELAILE